MVGNRLVVALVFVHACDCIAVSVPSLAPSLARSLRTNERTKRNETLLLFFQGSLNLVGKGQIFGNAELDLYGCTNALKTAAHDPRIRGVLMELNSEDMSMAPIMEVRGEDTII